MEQCEIHVSIPSINKTITIEIPRECTIGDIQKEVENRAHAEQSTLQTIEYALFPSIDKNIVNSSPPLEKEELFTTLNQVKENNKKKT